MGFLFILVVVVLVIIYSRQSKPTENNPNINSQLSKRNEEWASFIAGYVLVAKSKAEKQLLAKMLSDIKQQDLVDSEYAEKLINNLHATNTVAAVVGTEAKQGLVINTEDDDHLVQEKPEETHVETHSSDKKDALAIKLDNISLLLYFGAFLFVASAGLFVSFADVSGVARTLVVAVVTLALYATGIWIFRNKQAIKPAGLTFAAIGMCIAPLIGVAAYKYIFTDNPSLVWFGTSLLCLGLYLHSLFAIRKPLVNYVFIFTFLSLFESGVSIINAPIYYFGWAMALTGILVQICARIKNFWPDFQESSRISSQLFLPLALVVSLALVGREGIGQLGVSLLLATAFYGLEALNSSNETRQNNALVSHISALSGIGCVSFAIGSSLPITGGILLALAVLQTLVLLSTKRQTNIMHNFASVIMLSGLVGVAFFWQNYTALISGVSLFTAISLVIWIKQKRTDAYVLGILGWISIPIIYGQLISHPAISLALQAWLVVGSLLLHGCLFVAVVPKNKDTVFKDSARTALIVHILLTVALALLLTPGTTLAIVILIGLSMLVLSFSDDGETWSILSGIVVSISIFKCWAGNLMPIALFVSLFYNILLALRFRSESNRWLSTILWLVMPLALGSGNQWSGEQYAWFYIISMIALIASRAIARGVVLASSKIPLAAYAKTASLSYVVGYVLAAVFALVASLSSDSSQLHTSLIIAVLSVFVCVVGWWVEKRSDITALQPIIWQLLLLSIMRPNLSSDSLSIYLLITTLLAALCYVISSMLIGNSRYERFINVQTAQVSIITAFIAPFSIIFIGRTVWTMPLGLLVGGIILFDYWRNHAQENKEFACGVIVASVLWFMYLFGVREIQAYTHIVALMFAGFAYWRDYLNNQQESDNYLYLMLATATLPLVLQALTGQAGGLYGWWLLLEQVGFMILGIAIKRKFVTMWGLYVAVGAVLYQLRDLGWAALTVLALFIIGVAVYQLQKYNKPDK